MGFYLCICTYAYMYVYVCMHVEIMNTHTRTCIHIHVHACKLAKKYRKENQTSSNLYLHSVRDMLCFAFVCFIFLLVCWFGWGVLLLLLFILGVVFGLVWFGLYWFGFLLGLVSFGLLFVFVCFCFCFVPQGDISNIDLHYSTLYPSRSHTDLIKI